MGKIEMIECSICGRLNPIDSTVCTYKKCRNKLSQKSKIIEAEEDMLGKMTTRPKEKMGYGEHFFNFMIRLFILSIILSILLWLIGFFAPVIIPLAIIITIFTIFIYPIIKLKERIKKRDK